MKTVNSAFFNRLQGNDISGLCEMVELYTPAGALYWTTCNAPVVNSGHTYDPFPGTSDQGMEEDTNLTIGTQGFTVANTGMLATLMAANVLDVASIYVFRTFADTPGLGNVAVFRGMLGDFSYNRLSVSGTVRSPLQMASADWPYYTYMDTCVWRFGGPGCGVNTSSITIVCSSFNASSSTAVNLVATSGTFTRSYAPGQLERGRVTILTGSNSGQVRTVRLSSGDVLGLSHSLPYAPQSGDVWSVYPGCRKRFVTDCVSKYNNAERFFGAPWMPLQEQAF
jgi:uncharacterized phage protein (TIGR02218 family)